MNKLSYPLVFGALAFGLPRAMSMIEIRAADVIRFFMGQLLQLTSYAPVLHGTSLK
jgi:hypothetical protein